MTDHSDAMNAKVELSAIQSDQRAHARRGLVDVAVIGCGAAAMMLYRKPLLRLQRMGLIRLVATADPSESRARNLADGFGSAAVFPEHMAAFEHTRPELTIVTSPAHLHAQHVVAALQGGSHVLCEKPMASSTRDCDEMLEAAAQGSRLLGVGMVRRFFPNYAQLAQLIAAGALGELLAFDYCEGRRFDWEVTTLAAFRPRSQGGTGVLYDIGPHAIDYLISLFGDPRVESYRDDCLGGVETTAEIRLSFAEIKGRVLLSWESPLRNELRVRGRKGEAVLPLDEFDRLAVNCGAGWQETPPQVSFAADLQPQSPRRLRPRLHTQAIFCQLVQALRSIRLGEPPAASGAEGRACISLLEQALEIARPIPMTWLGPEDQERSVQLHWTGAP